MGNSVNAIVIAAARPVAVVLLAGIIKFLWDYQHDPVLQPAIIDGALTAALMASSFLGVNGVVSGVQNAKAQQAARLAAKE